MEYNQQEQDQNVLTTPVDEDNLPILRIAGEQGEESGQDNNSSSADKMEYAPIDGSDVTPPPQKKRRKGVYAFLLLVLAALIGTGWYYSRQMLGERNLQRGLTQYESENYEDALRLFAKSSRFGNPQGTYYYGLCLFQGYGGKPDLKQIVKLVESAAWSGVTDAQNRMGIFYANGIGVRQDRSEAVLWFGTAAGNGNTKAMVNLASCYLKGEGVDVNPTEALNWIRAALDKGEPSAYHLVGSIFEQGLAGFPRNLENALKWYRQGSAQGDHLSEFKYGALAIESEDDDEVREANKRIRRAINAKIPDALVFQAKYGRRELAFSTKESFELLEQGYRLGDMSAIIEIADILLDNPNATIKEKAEECLKLAAESSSEYYYLLMGQVINNSIDGGKYASLAKYFPGVKLDLKTSFEYFRKAAELGNPHAQIEVAKCYFDGLGVVQNMDKGIEWLQAASNNGNTEATYLLAKLSDGHNRRECLQEDPALAFKSYQKVLSEEPVSSQYLRDKMALVTQVEWLWAQYRLAICHDEGYGTPQDTASALNLLYDAIQTMERKQLTWQEKELYQLCCTTFVEVCYKNNMVPGEMQDVSKVFRTAIELLEASGRQEDATYQAHALYMMGYCLTKGVGGEMKAPGMAFDKYFKPAANLGDAKAQYACGVFLERGQYVAKNLEQAKKYYHSAAKAGNVKAIATMNRFN